MGFFDAPEENITPTFLKKCGFYKDRWGGLQDRKKPTSVFYEKLIYDEDKTHVLATIKYFPNQFDGYTNFGISRGWYGHGFGAGKFVVTYEDHFWVPNKENPNYIDTRVFDAFHRLCYEPMIEEFAADLKEKGYNIKEINL